MFNVKQTVERYGKALKALIIFGSSVYSPLRSKDLDLLVIVDKLVDVKEKFMIEAEVFRNLSRVIPRKPIDVTVFDVDTFMENAKPGGVVSGLILGFRSLYDELNVPALVEELTRRIVDEDGYVLIKGGREINISLLAKMKKQLKSRGCNGQ